MAHRSSSHLTSTTSNPTYVTTSSASLSNPQFPSPPSPLPSSMNSSKVSSSISPTRTYSASKSKTSSITSILSSRISHISALISSSISSRVSYPTSVFSSPISIHSRPAHFDGDLFLDRLASYSNAFKIYTFFLLTIVRSKESNQHANNKQKATSRIRKKQSSNSWNLESQRCRILNLIANSLEINLALLFGSSAPDENYLLFVVKHAFSMFENQALLKDADPKDALCRIIGTCATKYHYTAQTCASILHLIHKFDFVSTHVADIMAWAEKKCADGSLAVSLIREIGRTNPKDYVRDTIGAENVGRFLVELADHLPKLVSTNVGILVPHFGGESYKIRNALLGVLGKLVSKAFKDVDGDSSAKSI